MEVGDWLDRVVVVWLRGCQDSCVGDSGGFLLSGCLLAEGSRRGMGLPAKLGASWQAGGPAVGVRILGTVRTLGSRGEGREEDRDSLVALPQCLLPWELRVC